MFFDNYFNDINSSGPLFYMNELSINGKQVTNDDEDEDEDYTAIEDDYDTDDEDVDIDDEDNDLEDYTEDDSYENDGEDNNQDANVEDDEDTDYTAIQDDNGTEQTTDAAEENNDNTDDTDVDVDADDDTAADDDTENKNAADGNSDLPDPEADLKDAIGDTGGGGDDGADGGTDAGSDGASNNTPGEVDDLTAENPDSGGGYEENKGDAADDNDQNSKGANTDDASNDDPNSLKSLEKDLFADLTPEQLSIKNSELLQNYIDLYDSLETIFDNVNKIPKTYTNTRAIEFIADKLVELKEMVNQVITTTYITKTYVENLTVYKQCLLMLQQLNTMLKGLVQHQSK